MECQFDKITERYCKHYLYSQDYKKLSHVKIAAIVTILLKVFISFLFDHHFTLIKIKVSYIITFLHLQKYSLFLKAAFKDTPYSQ